MAPSKYQEIQLIDLPKIGLAQCNGKYGNESTVFILSQYTRSQKNVHFLYKKFITQVSRTLSLRDISWLKDLRHTIRVKMLFADYLLKSPCTFSNYF